MDDVAGSVWAPSGTGQTRRNSVFAAMHEEAAPPAAPPAARVPVYWVINRIVNATERSLLVSQLKEGHYTVTAPMFSAT